MSRELDEIEASEPPAPAHGSPPWMTTFADMTILLLTFFVMLLSFANLDLAKFKEISGSFRYAFGVQDPQSGQPGEGAVPVIPLPQDLVQQPGDSAATQRETVAVLTRALAEDDAGGALELDRDDRGVTLRLAGDLLFAPGSAELRAEGKPLLDRVSRMTRALPFDLAIEGHTDDLPADPKQWPTNWHLSAARAISALLYLVESGGVDPKRLSCTGIADMRPLVPNDSPAHRARNRRIEFQFSASRRALLREKP
jgi:chemotaxis protein MotB